MLRLNRLIVCSVLALIFVYTVEVYAQTNETTQRVRRLTGPPSNELTGDPMPEAKYGLLCYSFATGRLVDTCRVEFHLGDIGAIGVAVDCVPDAEGRITALQCANGGHTHGPPDFPNSPRPRTLFNEAVRYPGDELTDPVTGKFDVLGFSPLNSMTAVSWFVPQSSGTYTFNAKLTATPGFAFFWIPRKVTTIETLGSIRLTQVSQGYQQLPDSPAEYLKVRGGRVKTDPVGSDPDHVDAVAFGAAPITHTVMPLIASDYTRRSGRMLSINDISLPMGGVYDDDQDWQDPHKEHRSGRDVDLNQGGVACKPDLHLRQSVNKYLVKLDFTSSGPRKPPSALLCESGGRKHIDITWLVTGPII